MRNSLLIPIYNEIFTDPFTKGTLKEKYMMQQMVYLLQGLGVNIGDYKFDYYKLGPFSKVLSKDMCHADACPLFKARYIPNVKHQIKSLAEVFNDSVGVAAYEQDQWIECLSCIHYLRTYILPINTTKEALLLELKEKNKHLSDDNINGRAYDFINNLYYCNFCAKIHDVFPSGKISIQ